MKIKISLVLLLTIVFSLTSCTSDETPFNSEKLSSEKSDSIDSQNSDGSQDSKSDESYSDSNSDEDIDEVNCYYFDSSSVDSKGTKDKPFNSLDDVSKIEFKPGTKLLFKSGNTFKGSLRLNGIKGEEDKPVIISNYGGDERAKIDGDNTIGKGVIYISNCEYIRVENLEVYDSATAENDRRGVLVELNNPDSKAEITTYHDIVLDNLYIHDINGYSDASECGMTTRSKVTGGVQLWSYDGYGRADGFTVENCVIRDVSNVGIATWYKVRDLSVSKVSPYSSDFSKYAHSNINIRNNDISYIAKNAIFLRNAVDSYIEDNIVHDTAIKCLAGNSIVTSYVDSVIVQRNEGYRNRASKQSDGKVQDGAMLDSDLQSKRVIFQYNYSHDNTYGLFLTCDAQKKTDSGIKDEIVVRYNLSIADKGTKGIIYLNYYVGLVECYNNTIITASESPVILQVNDGRSLNFYNNLIYSNSNKSSISLGDKTSLSMKKNVFYSKGTIDNLVTADGEYYSFDPIPEKSVDALDISSRIGRGLGANYAHMKDSKLYDATNCVAIESKPQDFLGDEYSPSIGCINRY